MSVWIEKDGKKGWIVHAEHNGKHASKRCTYKYETEHLKQVAEENSGSRPPR